MLHFRLKSSPWHLNRSQQSSVQSLRVELMSAIHLAALFKSTRHVCLLDETWHIRLFLDFYYFYFFYHRLTYRSSAVIFLLYSSNIRKYWPYNFLFHFHTILLDILNVTVIRLQATFSQYWLILNELFTFIFPFSC